MEHNLSDVEQRVKRYWYSDGIVELSIGGMFLLLGLYFGIQGFFGESSTVGVILQVSMILVLLGAILGSQWVINTLKTRLTYPRTGYVQYHKNEKDARQRRYVILAMMLIITIASMVLVDYLRRFDSTVLGAGLIAAVILVALGSKSSGVKRFYVLGICSLILGIVLSLSGLSGGYNLALFYGLLGIAIMTSGGLVLRCYLSDNTMPAGNEND